MMRVTRNFDAVASSPYANEVERELLNSDLDPGAHRMSALRGLLVAGGLSSPLWIALYFLLR